MPGFSLLGSLSCSSPLIWQRAHWIPEPRIACWCCQAFYCKTQFAEVHHPPLKLWKQDIRSQPWKHVRSLTVTLLRGWILSVRDLWSVNIQAPLHSASAGVCWYCIQWSYGPIFLVKTPFKMLSLWVRQVKPTQTDHEDPELNSSFPETPCWIYSIPLTWLHVSAGSQPHHWSTSPACPRKVNGGAALNLASFSTLVLLATSCTQIYIRT